ncbi:MAG: hypothetical protein HQL42_16105 [Alphaproteobacteria bacterium]|nr:hypothetical protein [Alphaproteobacteria bacterium]
MEVLAVSHFCITLDVDWAPDFVIDHVSEMLLSTGVKATWMVTHDSPAIDRLRSFPDLFELGIHPNFGAGSSHGTTVPEILDSCLRMVPGARVMRTHSLHQSSPILDLVTQLTPVVVDLSLFLPHHANLHPVIARTGPGRHLTRLPYRWEDDHEMLEPNPDWSLNWLEQASGLCILDFHPIHIALNSCSLEPYAELKRRVGGRLQDAQPHHLDGLITQGGGAATAFRRAMSMPAHSHVADIMAAIEGAA